MFVAYIGNGCETPENHDLAFPGPGRHSTTKIAPSQTYSNYPVAKVTDEACTHVVREGEETITTVSTAAQMGASQSSGTAHYLAETTICD